MERCNDKDLFIEPHPLEGIVLDIDTPCSQKAITSLPDNFQISLKSATIIQYTIKGRFMSR